MSIHFKPLTRADLPLLTRWLQQPHVREFWDDGERDEAAVEAHYFAPERGATGFIFSVGGRPAGYIQCYPVTAESEYGKYAHPDGETWGIDLLIGDPRLTGQGLASLVIEAFISSLLRQRPSLRRILIDPDHNNGRALRAYARAGFQQVGAWGTLTIMQRAVSGEG